MAIYYKDGFYNDAINTIPEGAVEITDAIYKQLLEGQSRGELIKTDDSGMPYLRPPQPTPYHEWDGAEWVLSAEKQQEQFTAEKQNKLNEASQKAQAIINQVSGVDSLPDFEVQSWISQADEAQAWAKDNSAPTPILSAIAQARGVPVEVLRQKALAKAQAYALLTATIAGQRQRFEDAIKAAKDMNALNAIDITYRLPQVSA